MARKAGSWALLGGLALAAAWQSGGCDAPPEAPPAPPAMQEVLGSLPTNVVLPRLATFREQLVLLKGPIEAWRTGGSAQDRDLARVAFVDAMRVWQELEAMQIGPIASALTSDHGQYLRDEIYSWPTVSPCRVDQETVEAGWSSPTWFDDNLVNVYGLDALEHLLFAGPDNTCPGQIPINADGTWDALGPAGVDANRAAYASAVLDHLLVDVDRTRDALAAHPLDAATYGSEQAALNDVFDALFYLETHVQDRKMAEPLGLRDCTIDCLELVESRGLSGASHVWLAHDVLGVRDLFTGGEGPGFPELLAGSGRQDLADGFLAALDQAHADLVALPGPVDESSALAPAALERAYASVQAAADILRVDIATALLLEIPNEAAGDND
ncbi:MAG: imelysin family protein [Alphaproteobacteria bacterium]|nr:imelysin family protein [Alphaproteobacteria bacterium]